MNTPAIEKAIAYLALERKMLSIEDAASIIRTSRAGSPKKLTDLLLEQIPEEQILKAVAEELNMVFFDLFSTNAAFHMDEGVLARSDIKSLKRFSALPMVDRAGNVVVVTANPFDSFMVEYVRTRYPRVSLALASKVQIQNKLTYLAADAEVASLGLSSSGVSSISAPLLGAASASKESQFNSVTKDWVDAVLARAVAEGASDIHFMMTSEKSLLLRFRVDGLLRQQLVPPSLKAIEVIVSVMARCPTMSQSDLTRPQDGTFTFEAADRKIDARVAMLPQLEGPTLVVRLLDSNNMRIRLDDMGFSEEQLSQVRKAISAPQGTILVCGPTGSGKSTTLYGLLKEVDAVSKSVFTVENPVEYKLPFIGQTAIRDDLGERSLTFAKALRSILRLDPDIILVGEIRDLETADVAMQAANTGHLVLSTTHSSSAIGAYSRLRHMKVPSHLVSEAISLIIAQRLMRKVHDCSRLDPPTAEEVIALESIGAPVPEKVRHVVGCPACNGTGYRGRMAVVEMLTPTPKIRALVKKEASSLEIAQEARKHGFRSLMEDGLRHLKDQKTTVSELVRVLAFEDVENEEED